MLLITEDGLRENRVETFNATYVNKLFLLLFIYRYPRVILMSSFYYYFYYYFIQSEEFKLRRLNILKRKHFRKS